MKSRSRIDFKILGQSRRVYLFCDHIISVAANPNGDGSFIETPKDSYGVEGTPTEILDAIDRADR